MDIRPCLSGSHSTAPEKNKRTKALASAWVVERVFIFSSIIFHSGRGYTNSECSSPRVRTNCSPRPSRNFAGTITRPFSSRECWYSPINNRPSPQFLHFTPLHSTYRLVLFIMLHFL